VGKILRQEQAPGKNGDKRRSCSISNKYKRAMYKTTRQFRTENEWGDLSDEYRKKTG